MNNRRFHDIMAYRHPASGSGAGGRGRGTSTLTPALAGTRRPRVKWPCSKWVSTRAARPILLGLAVMCAGFIPIRPRQSYQFFEQIVLDCIFPRTHLTLDHLTRWLFVHCSASGARPRRSRNRPNSRIADTLPGPEGSAYARTDLPRLRGVGAIASSQQEDLEFEVVAASAPVPEARRGREGR